MTFRTNNNSDITLETPVQFVRGVGPRRAEQLNQLKIITVEDLLTYYPRRFDLRKQTQPIESVYEGQDNATVAGTVVATRLKRTRKMPIFEVTLEDNSAAIDVKWFHGMYLANSIKQGMVLAISGKVGSYKGQFQFTNPSHQIIYDPLGANLEQDELLPVYPAGAKLTSPIIGKIITQVLPSCDGLIREWFDREYLAKRDLMSRPLAISAMHRPEDTDHWKHARRRLAYDECLLMQLGVAIMRNSEVSRPAHKLAITPEIDRRIRARFPFEMTGAQSRVAQEISADLAKARPMNRLVQGDVGSGKTVVAVYASLQAVANKKQVVIMAPTEILATQHYKKIVKYLEGSQVKTALIVGSMTRSKSERTLAELRSGNVHIVVGTHALLSEKVKFKDLGLVVIDEQHKFGVTQRTGIRGKGFAPHYLVMTATPIPRTLAMTVFGDLDVSTIDERPPGRGKVETKCVKQNKFAEVLNFTEQKLKEGQQAYFIYPLVTPSAQLELKAAREAFKELKASQLGKYGVGLVHGQMSPDEKTQIMRDFHAGDIKVLVASVVVEVGVDVAAANVMVINHAERFGLAQLHQLRGRIGRSTHDATCILVAEPNNPTAQQRMDVLVETNDGFRIAEEDLRIRGPGQIFGTKQHGLPELKVADLVEDFDLLRMARRDAFEIVDEDPDLAAPHNQQLKRMMLKMYAEKLGLITGG